MASPPRTQAGAPLQAQLEAGIAALRLPQPLPPTAVPALLAYLAELQKWNAAYNLTAVRDPAEMVTRHLLDSLAILPLLGDVATLLDAGSGAGLPGIPLALAAPALQVTVLDSNGKKARFLRHAQRTLGLANLQVVEARAEAHRPAQPYDCITSRAFAALGDFLRATAGSGRGPLPGDSGAAHTRWLAMKGRLDEAELGELPDGFELERVEPLLVPGLREARHAVIARRR